MYNVHVLCMRTISSCVRTSVVQKCIPYSRHGKIDVVCFSWALSAKHVMDVIVMVIYDYRLKNKRATDVVLRTQSAFKPFDVKTES